jgi:hypothetical protein
MADPAGGTRAEQDRTEAPADPAASGGNGGDEARNPAMGWPGIIAITLYFLIFSITTTYILVRIWPVDSAESAVRAPESGRDTTSAALVSPSDTVNYPGKRGDDDKVRLFSGWVVLDFTRGEERRLILIALLMGGLGAFISSALSFSTYWGSCQLKASWGLWYLFRPPVGMALGALTYFLLRGGLLNGGGNVSAVSPFGVAGIAGVMGMFVKEATDKLRKVAVALFTGEDKEKPRADPLAEPPQDTRPAEGQTKQDQDAT